MERKYIRKVFFAPALMLLLPSMVAEAKTKLEAKNKTVTIGNTYQMKLKRVSGTKKEVKDWKISGEDAGYFKITDYGLLQMEGGPDYTNHAWRQR